MNQSIKVIQEGKSWNAANCYHACQLSGIPVTIDGETRYVEARFCVYCKKCLPIGEATESPESAVELRAAELAYMTDDEREAAFAGQPDLVFAFAEGLCDGEILPHATPGEQAAWLAAQIILHEMSDNPMKGPL